MIDNMMLKYIKILKQGGAYNDFLLNIFNALQTYSDLEFLKFIRNKRYTWEEDKLADIDN